MMRVHRFFTFIALFFLTITSEAVALDWDFYWPESTGNRINDSYSPDNGITVFLAGSGGTILKYDGTNFTRMETPTTLPLNAIHGSGPNDIWAVGGSEWRDFSDEGGAVALHYDGSTWASYTLPSEYYEITGVHVVGSNEAWAVATDKNYVYKWNGSSWDQINLANYSSPAISFTAGFRDVCGTGGDAIWFTGDVNQAAFWDGSTFTDISPSSVQGYAEFRHCWAADSHTAFIGTEWGGIAKLSSDGTYEAISHDGETSSVTGITGTSVTDVYFSGYAGYLLHYDGSSSASQVIPNDFLLRDGLIRLSNGNWLVQAGQYGPRFQIYDGENIEFITEASPLPKNFYPDTFFTGTELWVIPSRVNDNSKIQRLASQRSGTIETDAGTNWLVTGATMIREQDLLLGASDNDGARKNYRYVNSQWQILEDSPSYLNLYDAVLTQSDDLFVVNGDLYKNGDVYKNGVVSLGCPGSSCVAIASCGDTVFTVGTNGKVWSHFNGLWSEEDSGVSVNLTDVACSDNHVYAVGEDRTAIWKSTLSGDWQVVDNADLYDSGGFDFNTIVHVNDTTFAASLVGSQRSEWTSFLYSFSSGVATLDKAWLGPSLKIESLASNGETVVAVGWPGVLLYAGKKPEFKFSSNQLNLPALMLLL